MNSGEPRNHVFVSTKAIRDSGVCTFIGAGGVPTSDYAAVKATRATSTPLIWPHAFATREACVVNISANDSHSQHSSHGGTLPQLLSQTSTHKRMWHCPFPSPFFFSPPSCHLSVLVTSFYCPFLGVCVDACSRHAVSHIFSLFILSSSCSPSASCPIPWMSLFLDGADPFEGLRVLPREPEQLRHHLSRIHHTLQTRFYVSADLSEFALQPDRSEEFLQGYQKEVERTIAALNTHCRRSQIKVRVDPLRYRAGLELTRVAACAGNAAAAAPDAMSPSQTNGWGEMVSPSLTAKLESRQEAEHQLFLAGQSTPATDNNGFSPDALSTGGGALINSEAKTDRDSYLFSTPPEFKGFGNATLTSPADGVSPGS